MKVKKKQKILNRIQKELKPEQEQPKTDEPVIEVEKEIQKPSTPKDLYVINNKTTVTIEPELKQTPIQELKPEVKVKQEFIRPKTDE